MADQDDITEPNGTADFVAEELPATQVAQTARDDEGVEHWKQMARTHEREAKQLRKELEKSRTATLSEAERAIQEAEDRGRMAAKSEFAQELAAARIKAALTGIVDDPDTLIEDLNLAKYVDSDGNVDATAVATLQTKYKNLTKRNSPSAGAGRTGAPSQKTNADIFSDLMDQF